jgi:hypothetical protein
MLNVVITSFEIAMNDRPHFQNLKYVVFFTGQVLTDAHYIGCVCYLRWFLYANHRDYTWTDYMVGQIDETYS